MKRWLCWWLGCKDIPEWPQCERCGAEYTSDPNYVDAGAWWRIKRWLKRRFAWMLRTECLECGKRFWGRGYNGDHYCEKCFNNWIPF